MSGMRLHLHLSLVAAMLTFLEFIIVWIPVKMLAANFEGRSALASGVLHIL